MGTVLHSSGIRVLYSAISLAIFSVVGMAGGCIQGARARATTAPLWARQRRRSWAGGESTVWTEGRQSRSGADQWEDQITRGGSVR